MQHTGRACAQRGTLLSIPAARPSTHSYVYARSAPRVRLARVCHLPQPGMRSARSKWRKFAVARRRLRFSPPPWSSPASRDHQLSRRGRRTGRPFPERRAVPVLAVHLPAVDLSRDASAPKSGARHPRRVHVRRRALSFVRSNSRAHARTCTHLSP